MDLVYLDYNGFQRPFDDPSQVRVQMEALACQTIFGMAAQGNITLIWSFIHTDENALCPFPDRRLEVEHLSTVCTCRVGPREGIREMAHTIQERSRISSKDALHLACALEAGATHFLTCDDRLLRQAARLPLTLEVMNPIDYVR